MNKKYIIISHYQDEDDYKPIPKPSVFYGDYYKLVSPQKFWSLLKKDLKKDIEEDEYGFYASEYGGKDFDKNFEYFKETLEKEIYCELGDHIFKIEYEKQSILLK